MKLLPNINKSVPEAADPALIKPVSDALEALDTALGAAPSTLTTVAKTLVGAINELAPVSGSNATGSWIKFSEGTMITYQRVSVGSGLTWSAEGSGYRAEVPEVAFPQTFISAPVLNITVSGPQGGFIWATGSTLGGSTSKLLGWSLLSFTNPSAVTMSISVVAIGRWK